MTIKNCSEADVPTLSILFDEYRMFYGYESDIEESRKFLSRNLGHNVSSIFMLSDDVHGPCGIAQIYPAICSLEMKEYFYFSDLYIRQNARRNGYGRKLILHIIEFCKSKNAVRLSLDTASINHSAQSLYKSLGFIREDEFVTYDLALLDQ